MTPGSRSITEGLPDAKFLRLTAFGVFWFFVTLSIESSVFPIGVELIFEHRVYLPSIGFFMAITALALTLVEKKPALAKPAVAVCIALIVALAAAAYARNSVWRTEVDLWQDAAFKSPGKARTRLSYGMALTDMGMYDEAIREFRAALSIDPKLAKAHNNLGLTYFKMGGVDEAVREYKLALDIMPDYAFARNNLAVAYNKLGLADMAVAEFKKGLSVNYYDVLAHDTLGVTYAMQGRLDEAIDEFRTALSINPGFAKAREHLEKALAQKSGETSR